MNLEVRWQAFDLALMTQINTNLIAPIHLIAAFLPVLSKRQNPVLGIVTSCTSDPHASI